MTSAPDLPPDEEIARLRPWLPWLLAMWSTLPAAAAGWFLGWAFTGTALWLLPAAVAAAAAAATFTHFRTALRMLRTHRS